MAQLGDAYISFPLSGSSSPNNVPAAVFLRMAQQVSSASSFYAFHPGGSQVTAMLIAPRNNNRLRWSIINSGALPLLIDHGAFGP